MHDWSREELEQSSAAFPVLKGARYLGLGHPQDRELANRISSTLQEAPKEGRFLGLGHLQDRELDNGISSTLQEARGRPGAAVG